VIIEKKVVPLQRFRRRFRNESYQVLRIGAAFAQDSEHASITDYINRLRLDHARELLTTRPEMSIDEVATASGFSVRRTFSRLFKEKFGLTPTEFREAASAEAKLD
jgi:transcriptional regulator GlxA family with amidase domain